MKNCTTAEKADAMRSCDGPVKMADGKISPKTSTSVTDKTTAIQGAGTRRSKKIGRASLTPALTRRSVTRSK